MKKLIEKLRKLEVDMAIERGPFDFFAMIIPENRLDKWDIVAAAPWIDANKMAGLKYMSDKIAGALTGSDLISISRVVPLDRSNPDIRAYQKAFGVEHGALEIRNSELFGLPIKHAIIVTSQSTTNGLRRKKSA